MPFSLFNPLSTFQTALKLLALFALLLIFFGCAKFNAKVPENFARYNDFPSVFRAVSPDGILYRVRQIPHKPKASLFFWREAVLKRSKDAGYVFVDTAAIYLGQIPGFLIELAASQGLEDHTYLIAVFPRNKHIIVAEASGEVTKFMERREEILTALISIHIKP